MKNPATLPDRAQAVALIKQWASRIQALDAIMEKLDAVLSPMPECSLYQEIWSMVDEYTDTLAALIGDEEGFLAWYHTECRLGATPKEVIFTDGDTLVVVGAEDLLTAIWTTEDGCRDWGDDNARALTRGASEMPEK